jgi:hypothetical protein
MRSFFAGSDTPGAVIRRRLVLALVVSIAVHFAVASRLRMPQPPAPIQPLEATLVAAEEAPPPAPAAAERHLAAAPKRPPPPRKPPKPARSVAPVPALPTVTDPLGTAAAGAESSEPGTQPATVAESTPASPSASPPQPVADEPAVTALRMERPLAPQGAIQFDIYFGANRFLVGHSELSWRIADDRYRLATNGKTIGLAALFYPFGMSSTSEGRVTAAGFEPDFFRLDQTGRKGEKQFRVEFDRAAGIARFTDPSGVRDVPLRPSTLDILSLVCQLSVAKLEPGPLRLNLTNGRKLDTYDVEVGPQEIVETPMGDLRAVYVKQVRKPGDEGIEVWLAVDFAYLPVRMRFTDRKGSIAGEQLVTAVQLVRG